MKYLSQVLLLLSAITIMSSCKKDEIETSAITSLIVGNFIVNGKTILLGSNTTKIINNNPNGAQMALRSGSNNLYVWPEGDSLHPYFTYPKFDTQDREIYSLFLCGDTLATEGIIIRENFPEHSDSTVGIRFINLSPNSTPLNITLSTSSTVNEVSNLGYKQYTDFISYGGKYNSSFTFQIRLASSPNSVITSFSFNAASLPRFANVTLVMRGMIGGVPAFGVTRVNNDR